MAIQNFPIATFTLDSTFLAKSTRDSPSITYHSYSTPSTVSATKTVDISAYVTAGCSIQSAKVYFAASSTYGGTYTPAYGANVSATVGGNASVTFTFKSNTGGSYPAYPSTYPATASKTNTGTLTVSDAYVQITYTPPTAPTVSNVKLANSTATQYAGAGANVTLSWTGTNGTNNAISSYTIQRSDNGGSYVNIKTGQTSTSYTVAANPAAGEYYQYKVIAVAPYGNSNAVASPKVYTRSAVGAPASCSVSPTECYPGDSVTLSWGAGSAGTGTSVAGYDVYRGATKVTTVTGTSYTFSAPNAGNYAYTVKTVSSPAGYNSGASPAAALLVENPRSTGVLSKVTVEMDDVSTIALTVSPVDPTYTHKAVWFLGSRSETQDTPTGNVFSLTVPKIWCDQLTNAVTGTASVRLETYKTGSKIGEIVYTFAVSVPADVVPTIGSFADTMLNAGLPEAITRYVQNYSKVKLDIAGAAGALGSTIVSYAITGGGYNATAATATFGALPTPGTIVFAAAITDTRGRQASASLSIVVHAYAKPSMTSTSIFRSDINGEPEDGGAFTRHKATAVFSSIDGQNSVVLEGRVYPKGGTPGAYTAMSSAVASVLGGGTLLSYMTYIGEIRITDLLGNTASYSVTLPTAIAGLHLLDEATGAAIGKYCEAAGELQVKEGWQVKADRFKSTVETGTAPLEVASTTVNTNLNADMVDGQHLSDLKLLMWPVGSIYQSSVSTSPATLFGGTWAVIAAGTFLVAAGTGYAVGETGGAASHTHTGPSHTHTGPSHTHTTGNHTLTVAQMPSHQHTTLIVRSARGTIAGNETYMSNIAGADPTTSAGGGGAHNHGSTGASGTGATGASGTGNTGSASSLPPYKAYYMWERTA